MFYIVDMIVPEIATESEIDERNFRKILDWCDIWIVLLRTTGKPLPRKLDITIRFLELIHIWYVDICIKVVIHFNCIVPKRISLFPEH
jgi:hypothetical protein